MNLTIDMVNKLHSVGFEFEQFEHICSPGRAYYFDGNVYTIGGSWNGATYSEFEETIACDGIWLPDEGDLVRWLELTNHDIEIKYNDSYYRGKAIDASGIVIDGGGGSLLCCLYKMIYKICKKSQGTVKPVSTIMLECEE